MLEIPDTVISPSLANLLDDSTHGSHFPGFVGSPYHLGMEREPSLSALSLYALFHSFTCFVKYVTSGLRTASPGIGITEKQLSAECARIHLERNKKGKKPLEKSSASVSEFPGGWQRCAVLHCAALISVAM